MGDYQPITDARLAELKGKLSPLLGTVCTLTLPIDTINRIIEELVDAREELFQLRLEKSVDRILAEELGLPTDDVMSCGHIKWPEDYCSDDPILGNGKPVIVKRPEATNRDTAAHPKIMPTLQMSPDQIGRRLPKVDPCG